MRLLSIVLTLSLFAAGCAAPPEPTQGLDGGDTEHASNPVPATRELEGIVANVGAYACLSEEGGPFVGNYHDWSRFHVQRPDGAEYAELTLSWEPVNPTMQSLQVGLTSFGNDQLNPEIRLGSGTSPWTLRLEPEVLNEVGSRFDLSVDVGETCQTTPGAGVHLSNTDYLDNPQHFSGTLTWR